MCVLTESKIDFLFAFVLLCKFSLDVHTHVHDVFNRMIVSKLNCWASHENVVLKVVVLRACVPASSVMLSNFPL